MKFKISISLFLIFSLFSIKMNSQSISISSSGDYFCPGEMYHFTVDESNNEYQISSYGWECTNGTIMGSDDASVVWVIWDNTTQGYLKLTVGHENGTMTAQRWFDIMSLNGIAPQNLRINGDDDINLCKNEYVKFAADDFRFPNNDLVIDFEWIIPVGWTTSDGVVSDGSPILKTDCSYPSIDVYSNLTTDGTIKVRGVNTTCNQVSYSNWSNPVTVNRDWPDDINYDVNGDTELICSNTEPITYTVDNISCATYNWSYPNGWTSNGSTSNQIILYPDGLTEGEVNTTATVGSFTKSYYAINIEYHSVDANNLPYITGQDVVCFSSTYEVHNVQEGQSIYWEKSSNIKILGGQGTSSLIISKFRDGHSWIKAIISSECDDITYTTEAKTFWAGRPGTPITYPAGYPTFEMQLGSVVCLRVTDEQGAEGDGFNWTITGSIEEMSQYANGCTVEAVEYGIGNFYVTTTNRCGTSPSGGGTVNVSYDGGGLPVPKSISIYPNPAKDILTVDLKNSEDISSLTQDKEVFIYNKMMNLVEYKKFDGNTCKINVSKLKTDVYILRLKIGSDIYEQQIIVSNK